MYLTGSHTWNNLVDMDASYPPHVFGFERYLSFLDAHHHNLIRLWAWQVPHPDDAAKYLGKKLGDTTLTRLTEEAIRSLPGRRVTSKIEGRIVRVENPASPPS